MKYLNPVVLCFAGLAVLALALHMEAGQRSRVAEVCIPQSVTTDDKGQPIERTFPVLPGAKIKNGYYSVVYSVNGFVFDGIRDDPPNPNLVCLLKVVINNGIASIECSRPAGRGCSTTCTLEQIPGQNGTTKHSCECSNRP